MTGMRGIDAARASRAFSQAFRSVFFDVGLVSVFATPIAT